jgi:hypothetical protein
LISTALTRSQPASTPCAIRGLWPVMFSAFPLVGVSCTLSKSPPRSGARASSVQAPTGRGSLLSLDSEVASSVPVHCSTARCSASATLGSRLGSFSTAPARSCSRRCE